MPENSEIILLSSSSCFNRSYAGNPYKRIITSICCNLQHILWYSHNLLILLNMYVLINITVCNYILHIKEGVIICTYNPFINSNLRIHLNL